MHTINTFQSNVLFKTRQCKLLPAVLPDSSLGGLDMVGKDGMG
jgi:hypothetical protein